MEELAIYLGKSGVALAAFFLAFLLLFQNRKEFRFNRIYLLSSQALSFVIPLITFTVIRDFQVPVTDLPSGSGMTPVSVEFAAVSSFHWEWYHFFFLIYLTGVAGGLIHLVLGHLKAATIIRQSRNAGICNAEICVSGEEIHPFSFFGTIVIPSGALTHPDLPLIIEHEKIHVKERHTLDILLSELFLLIQWFNPFAWLMRDAVKNNLEYKTDQQVVKNCDPTAYQLAMVSLADRKGIAPFLTAFNGSQLRNRIIMMKMKNEKKNGLTRKLLLMPLLALLVTGLSGREIQYEMNVEGAGLMQESVSREKDIIKNNQSDVVNIREIQDTTIRKKTSGKPLYIVDGKEFTGDVNDIKPEEISGITVLKDASSTALYGEKGKDGVVIINTKTKYNSEPVVTARRDTASQPEPLFFIVEEMPEFPGKEAALREFIAKTIQYPPAALEKGITGKVYVTFVVSKEGKVTRAKIARGVHPDLDKEALRVVNALPDWKPGMQRGKAVDVSYTVPVTFGIQGKTNSTGAATGNDKKPLIILDGNITEKNISDINPNEMAAICVLKGENAIQKYGDKAKDGAIEITLKDMSARITSPSAFRQFIAQKIKYPAEAQKSGLQGTAEVWIKIDDNGKITQVLPDPIPGEVQSLDEVVVVGYAAPVNPTSQTDGMSVVGYLQGADKTTAITKPLDVETGRVINMIPAIDIPEMKGKAVKVTVTFKLQ